MTRKEKKQQKKQRFIRLNDLYESLPGYSNRQERYRMACELYEQQYGTDPDLRYEIFMGRRNLIKNKEVPFTNKNMTA